MCAVRLRLATGIVEIPGQRGGWKAPPDGAELLPRLVRRGPGLVPVVLHVALCRFCGVMQGVMMMPVRRMSVMSRGFVIASFVMIRGVAMMLRRVFVMLGGLAMMRSCVLGHDSSVDILSWSVRRHAIGRM